MIEILEGKANRTATYPDGAPRPQWPQQIAPEWTEKHGPRLPAWLAATFMPQGVTIPDPAEPSHWRTVHDVAKGVDVLVVPGTETTEEIAVYGFVLKEPATGLELYRQEPELDPEAPELTNRGKTESVASRIRDELELGKPKAEVMAEIDRKVADMVEGHGKRLAWYASLRLIAQNRSG